MYAFCQKPADDVVSGVLVVMITATATVVIISGLCTTINNDDHWPFKTQQTKQQTTTITTTAITTKITTNQQTTKMTTNNKA